MGKLISPSAEFAEFIADVSDPGTGMIRSDRLARWLGVEEECLIRSWHASGYREWRAFASQILEILDAFQDVSLSLSRTLTWYCELPLPNSTNCQRPSTSRKEILGWSWPQPGICVAQH